MRGSETYTRLRPFEIGLETETSITSLLIDLHSPKPTGLVT